MITLHHSQVASGRNNLIKIVITVTKKKLSRFVGLKVGNHSYNYTPLQRCILQLIELH